MNNVQVFVTLPDDLPKIFCESNQIKQVLLNIMNNGIEAMPNGGILDIWVTTVEKDLQIHVKDSGVGIPADIIPRLGEPFYSLKEKGTGLGLMICFNIVHEHGGHITFDSEEGQGTLVTIQLPIHQEPVLSLNYERS